MTMKTLFTWIALVASTPFWLTSSALADDAAQYEIALAKERQQSITQAKTPDGIATQKIDWKTPGTGVGSFKIIPAEPLPLGWKIPAVSKLYIPEGGGLKSFNLRVEDASGETFQYYRTIPQGVTGWIALTNMVDVANPPRGDSWGGNADHIMDMPLTLSGAGFEIDKALTNGFYYLASIDSIPQENHAKRTRIDLSSGNVAVKILLPEERKQTNAFSMLAEGRQTARIDWNGGQEKYDLIFSEGVPVEHFGAALFHVKVFLPKTGLIKAMHLRLQDADGETLQYEQAVPCGAEGWYDIAFPIGGKMKARSSWGGSTTNQRIDFPAKLSALAGVFTDQEEKGWMGIGAIDIDIVSAPLDPVFETGNPISVLQTGSEDKLGWRIVNDTKSPVDATLKYTVKDASGILVGKDSVKARTLPGSDSFVQLPAPAKRGIYYVDMSYRQDGIVAPPVNKQQRFAYMMPAGPTPGKSEGFIFGVCSHSQWKPQKEQELQAMAASWCGVKVLREDFLWERMEASPGNWNFKFFDSVVETFSKHGIEVAPIYCYRPDWAVAKDWKPIKPESPRGKRPDFGHWANFVRTAAGRYGDKMRYAEVWNEPDLLGYANFTAEEYIEMMKIAYTETKKAAPEVTVLTGGFTMMPPFYNIVDPKHMEKTLVQGKGYYDAQAFHVHGTFEKYREQVDRLLALREELGITTPWWANETAITATGNGEYVQAVTLFQKFIYTWARGAMGYNWFSLCNAGNDPKNGEHNFGLLTKDFQPKAAYPVYNTIASYLTGAEYVRDFPLGSGIDAFLFKARNGDYLIANWKIDRETPARYAVINGIDNGVFAVDMFGNEEPLQTANGTVSFKVGLEPSFVRIAKQKTKPTAGLPPLELPDRIAVLPGVTNAVRIRVRNPMDVVANASITLSPSDDIKVLQTNLTRRIAPKEVAEMEFLLDVPSSFRSFGKNRKEIGIDAEIGSLWNGTFVSKILSAIDLPNGEFLEEPTIVIDEASQQTMLVPDAPDMVHLRWAGPEDLSAKVWMARSDENLQLKIVVKDDVHRQNKSGFEIFESDGIQVGIQPPGTRGLWEIGLALNDDMANEIYVWSAPDGLSTNGMAETVTLNASRDESAKTTTYIANLPMSEFRLQPVASEGSDFGFNILVNDDDAGVREGFIEFTPGIGRTKDPSLFPRVKLAH